MALIWHSHFHHHTYLSHIVHGKKNVVQDDSYRHPTRQSRSQSTARPKAPGAYKPWQAYGIPKGMPETAEKHFIGSYFTKEEAAEAVRVFEEGRQPVLSFNVPREHFPPASAPYHLLDPDLTPYRKAYDECSIPGIYRRKDGYWTATGTFYAQNTMQFVRFVPYYANISPHLFPPFCGHSHTLNLQAHVL